jgi:hypothetical protein
MPCRGKARALLCLTVRPHLLRVCTWQSGTLVACMLICTAREVPLAEQCQPV